MRRTFVAGGLVVLMCSTCAWAALDTSDAYVEGATTWAGTTTFDDGTHVLKGSVEWCVDWPAGSVYGHDLFKYKYQITVTGTSEVTLLSIPMLISNEADTITWALAPSPVTQIAPTDADFGGSYPALLSAYWTFGDNDPETPDELMPGDASYELSYLSINKPINSLGSLQDFGLGAYAIPLPAPSNEIPEPATMGLLAFGAIGLISRRKK